MKVGIGLPNTIPGTGGALFAPWAERAEKAGFSSLATIGRNAYPSYAPLIALSAAAAVTDRIELLTNVILGPTYDPVHFAKETASLDQISGGRLTLGVGVGARPDDYAVVGENFGDRGRRWDSALKLIHEAWKGKPILGSKKPVSPVPVRDGRIPLLIGGHSDAALRRIVTWGTGWTGSGSLSPEASGAFTERVRQAWRDAGRDGSPRCINLFYFVLGDRDRGVAYLKDYYGFRPEAERSAESTPSTPEAIRERIREYEAAGLDEVILDPTVANLDQVDRLADAVSEFL